MNPPVYADDVTRLLEQLKPRSILLLDSPGSRICSSYLQGQPQCQLDRLNDDGLLAQLQTRGRYDFCFVANVLERIEKTAAGHGLVRAGYRRT